MELIQRGIDLNTTLPELDRSIEPNITLPEIDLTPCYKDFRVTCMKVICMLFSICTYVANIVLDIVVAYKLSRVKEAGYETYFGLTIFFIVLPGVTMSVFSVLWYINDESNERLKAPVTHWIIRVIFLASLTAPLLRNLEAAYFAIKSVKSVGENQKEFYARRMVFENTDAALLRLFEAFLGNAPQVLLQLYVFTRAQYYRPNVLTEIDIIQLICIFTSILSMSCAVSSYQITLRDSLEYKNDYSCSIAVFPFLWRFFEITARLVTLGLFISVLIEFFILLNAVHYLIMFIFVRVIDTDFCGNRPGEFLYNMVLAIMYFVCFINPKFGPSRNRYIFYYCLMFVENSILISLWYYYRLKEREYELPALIMVFVCFALAMMIMTFYYAFLHPTRGKIYGNPTRKGNDALYQLQSIAEGYVIREEIRRARAEREEEGGIPLSTAANLPVKPSTDISCPKCCC